MRQRFLFDISVLLFVAACSPVPTPSLREPVTFVLQAGGPLTRSADPDEDRISDYNLLVYNAMGELEEKLYVSDREMEAQGASVSCSLRLVKDLPHSILAAVNLGYELPRLSLAEAMEYRYHMAYPDEFIGGIPMAGRLENFLPRAETVIRLERLMARVSIRIDRHTLDPEVVLKIREVKLGNCPSSVCLFDRSCAQTQEQLFLLGFLKEGHSCEPLNREEALGWSLELPFYLLENCQGNGLKPSVCSYVEIKASYNSPSWSSKPGEYLIYRFYLQDTPGQYDVIRNNHYHIIVRPEGDGLQCEDLWRMNREGLQPNAGTGP